MSESLYEHGIPIPNPISSPQNQSQIRIISDIFRQITVWYTAVRLIKNWEPTYPPPIREFAQVVKHQKQE